MYGTIAKMRIKPGALKELERLSRSWAKDISGLVSNAVYQMDDDSNVCYLVVAFEDKAAYLKNAESPEQAERYRKNLELLEEAPEWHDGEIVISSAQ